MKKLKELYALIPALIFFGFVASDMQLSSEATVRLVIAIGLLAVGSSLAITAGGSILSRLLSWVRLLFTQW